MTCSFAWCATSNHFHCRNDPPSSPPAEPTTTEAFATVRQYIADTWDDDGGVAPVSTSRTMAALALLERRMQEMPGQTFGALWKAVLPYLPPKARDDAHDDMFKALPND